MDYSRDYFEKVVKKYGEVFFVLDSDREYEVHGTDEYKFFNISETGIGGPKDTTMVHIEGLRGDEYLKVDFPLESIEHHYSHREV